MKMTAEEKAALVEKVVGSGVVWDDENWPSTLRLMNLMYYVLYHEVTSEKNQG